MLSVIRPSTGRQNFVLCCRDERRRQGVCDNPAVPEPDPPRPVARPLTPLRADARPVDKTLCERCGGEMYRMHAVWRCAACGFKTDCCGW